MSSNDLPELLQVVVLFADSGIDFVIIGGIAINLHGGDHYTSDVDFAYVRARENANKIADVLRPYNPKPVNWPEDLPFVWDAQTILNTTILTLQTDIGRIDLLGQPDGAPPYSQLRERAVRFEYQGRILQVASIEDLVSMKKAAGRFKDLGHIAELETIKRLLEEES